MPDTKTDRGAELAELTAEAIHQISHDIHAIRLFIEKHAGLLDAYQRGGLLAMRTARKRGNGGPGVQ